jgi:hypothetical protein
MQCNTGRPEIRRILQRGCQRPKMTAAASAARVAAATWRQAGSQAAHPHTHTHTCTPTAAVLNLETSLSREPKSASIAWSSAPLGGS